MVGSGACLSLVNRAEDVAAPNGKALPSVSKVIEAVPVLVNYIHLPRAVSLLFLSQEF